MLPNYLFDADVRFTLSDKPSVGVCYQITCLMLMLDLH